jgi:hypothetical protein
MERERLGDPDPQPAEQYAPPEIETRTPVDALMQDGVSGGPCVGG